LVEETPTISRWYRFASSTNSNYFPVRVGIFQLPNNSWWWFTHECATLSRVWLLCAASIRLSHLFRYVEKYSAELSSLFSLKIWKLLQKQLFREIWLFAMASSINRIFKFQTVLIYDLPLLLVQYLLFYVYTFPCHTTYNYFNSYNCLNATNWYCYDTLHVFVICHFSCFIVSTMCIHF